MESKELKKIGLINILNFCLIFTIIVSGFYYLKSMDDLVNARFELQTLKEKSTLLEEESKNLEMLRNELDSYENISTRINDLKMVRVNDIDYINLGDDSLAKR